VAGVLREGPVGSAWFAHFDYAGRRCARGCPRPDLQRLADGGRKVALPIAVEGSSSSKAGYHRAIDALSLAAIENLRGDTLYAATGGGMGPGRIAALEMTIDIKKSYRRKVCC
jgi:hypothetical protein